MEFHNNYSRWRGHGYRLLIIVISGVLFAASGLKASQYFSHPFLEQPWWSSPEILLEWALACWLLSGFAVRWAWRTVLLLFSGFVIVIFFQLNAGEDSCGCFGAIDIPPAYMLIFDAIVIACLLVFRPPPERSYHRLGQLQRIGSMTVAVCGVAVMSYVLFRDPLPDQSSDPVVSPLEKSTETSPTATHHAVGPLPKELVRDLGAIDPESSHPLSFEISNNTGRDVAIKKITAKCKCTRLQSPPNRLPAQQATRIHVIFDAPKKVADYSKSIELATDDTTTPAIRLVVKAAIGKYLEVKPQVLQLSANDNEASSERAVTILNHGKEPVRLIYATSNNPSVIARVPRKPIEPGGQVDVPIVVDKHTSTKSQAVPISIHTNSSAQPTIQVQIRLH